MKCNSCKREKSISRHQLLTQTSIQERRLIMGIFRRREKFYQLTSVKTPPHHHAIMATIMTTKMRGKRRTKSSKIMMIVYWPRRSCQKAYTWSKKINSRFIGLRRTTMERESGSRKMMMEMRQDLITMIKPIYRNRWRRWRSQKTRQVWPNYLIKTELEGSRLMTI